MFVASAAALGAFRSLPDTLCGPGGARRLTTVRLLLAAHLDREAAQYLRREVAGLRSGGAVAEVYWVLARAEVAERTGDPTASRRGYRFVLDQWRAADPAPSTLVERARAGLARVDGGRQSDLVSGPSRLRRLPGRCRREELGGVSPD